MSVHFTLPKTKCPVAELQPHGGRLSATPTSARGKRRVANRGKAKESAATVA